MPIEVIYCEVCGRPPEYCMEVDLHKDKFKE
jgi:hypothetical protein